MVEWCCLCVLFCCFYVCKIDSLQVSLTNIWMEVMTKRSKLIEEEIHTRQSVMSHDLIYLPWNRIPSCVLMLAFML